MTMMTRGLHAALLLSSLACAQANANLVFQVRETGGHVRLDYSGTLDLSGMAYVKLFAGLDEHALRLVTPAFGASYTAFTNLAALPVGRMRTYANPFASGPGVYYAGNVVPVSSFGGTSILLPTLSTATNATLRVDDQDIVGDVWSGSGFLQWNNTTIAALGISQPSAPWVLNNAAADTISMTVSAVPEPGTAALLVGGLGLVAWRRRQRSQRAR